MGLLEQEIKELRQMQRDIKANKISHDTAAIQLAIYSQVEKRANMMLKAMAIGAKFGSISLNRIIKTNLIGDGVAIEASDQEVEMIQCPEKDCMIQRRECLDFSGSNPGKCTGCEQFTITRKVLLGK